MWTKKITVKKVTSRGSQKKYDQLLIEKKTTLVDHLNKEHIFYHTQTNEKELFNGYLLTTYKHIPLKLKQEDDKSNNIIKVEESKNITQKKLDYPKKFHDTLIFKLTAEFHQSAMLFKDTAISESSGLAKNSDIISFAEDIDSFNSFYKAIGKLSIKQFEELNDLILLVSFKIDTKLVQLCSNIGIHAIISRTAPTAAAYDLAQKNQIKLIGFARGTKYNIYT